MDNLNAVPIKIPDWSGLVRERDRLAAELDAARARVAELETELAKVKGHRAELAERCYRKDLELDAWRTGERPDLNAVPAADTMSAGDVVRLRTLEQIEAEIDAARTDADRAASAKLRAVADAARKVSFHGEPGDLHRLREAVVALDDVSAADTTSGGEGPEGYVVAGPDVAGSANPGRLVSDWDGEVHLTREDGEVALAECRRSGYADWQLYALVRVALDAVPAADTTSGGEGDVVPAVLRPGTRRRPAALVPRLSR